jgi:flagellar motor switch protein FliN/FliY
MSGFANREMFTAIAEELGVVIGAMIESPVAVAPGAPAMGRQWIAEVQADGALTGTITVMFDHGGAAAITTLLTGVDGPDEALADTVREVLAQALGAVALESVARSAKLSVRGVTSSESGVPVGEWAAYAITAEKLPAPLVITTYGSLAAAQAGGAKASTGSKAVVPTAPASEKAAEPAKPLDDRIDVILDIDLPLVVRFGRTELPLRALTRLGPGSVIDLGRSPDDAVEVLVSNRVVARGEVVIVSGNYGIRILDVVSQRERVSSMEV